MTHAVNISPARTAQLLHVDREERLSSLTRKKGVWYTLPSGEKVRGADAADELLLSYLNGLQQEFDSMPTLENVKVEQPKEIVVGGREPSPPRSKYPEAPKPQDLKHVMETYDDGRVFYPSGHWLTSTNKRFNPNLPATIFTCDCGNRRVVHLQDVKQTDGRCITCVRRERRRRARRRQKERDQALAEEVKSE